MSEKNKQFKEVIKAYLDKRASRTIESTTTSGRHCCYGIR